MSPGVRVVEVDTEAFPLILLTSDDRQNGGVNIHLVTRFRYVEVFFRVRGVNDERDIQIGGSNGQIMGLCVLEEVLSLRFMENGMIPGNDDGGVLQTSVRFERVQ